MKDPPPKHRIPAWIRVFGPEALANLDDNPLHLRLSGAAYRRKPGLFNPWPHEMSFKHLNFVARIGWFPLLAMFTPQILLWVLSIPAMLAFFAGRMLLDRADGDWVLRLGGALAGAGGCVVALAVLLAWFFGAWGQLILVMRVLGMAGIPRLKSFVLNAQNEPWGQAIYLTAIQPEEIGRALFVDLFRREMKVYALLLGGIGAFSAALTPAFVQWDVPWDGATMLSDVFLIALVCSIALIEFWLLTSIKLISALSSAAFAPRNRTTGTFQVREDFLRICVIYFMGHGPGALLLSLLAAVVGFFTYGFNIAMLEGLRIPFASRAVDGPLEAFAVPLVLALIAVLFYLPNIRTILMLERERYQDFEKGFGKALLNHIPE